MESIIDIEIEEDLFLNAYLHLLEENDIDIEFIWGGRDSGKSQHVAQQLIKESLDSDYFRCILIKKTHESIKDSQWQTIKDIVEEWEIDQYFNFKTSPLEIDCKNKNKFLSRGCDNPGKLKSIRNPSHVWIEEGDQLTLEDFTTILTTARTNHGKVKFFFVFNPELPKGIIDKKDFWLYKNWFSHTNELNFTASKKFTTTYQGKPKEVEINYRSTNTTYIDNPYCTPERIAFHQSLKTDNPNKYIPYTLGLWGTYSNDMPFFVSYNDTKHATIEAFSPNINYMIDIGFDFNIAPCCAVVGQFNRHDLTWKTFDVIMADPTTKKGLSPLAAVCSEIREKYIDSGLFPSIKIRVTGDPSGKQGSADRQEASTFYHTIMKMLKINEGQLYLRKQSLTHVMSGEIINEVLKEIPNPNFLLCDIPELEQDIKRSYPDANKSLWEAKKKFGLHVLDAWRYLMDFWFAYINGDYSNNIQEIQSNIISLKKRIYAKAG